VPIFNEKEVDELAVLDIGATVQGREPDYQLIEEIAGECFMPLCYGGGIQRLEQVTRIVKSGVEKVIIGTAGHRHPELIEAAASVLGSQSVVGVIDAKKQWLRGYVPTIQSGKSIAGSDVVKAVKRMENAGAGEILVNAIDRDGTMQGYDLDLLKVIVSATHLPVIACGGAARVSDFETVVGQAGVSAVAAGSMFVFNGPHRAVLISYPSQEELRHELFERLD
jgi:cyclase